MTTSFVLLALLVGPPPCTKASATPVRYGDVVFLQSQFASRLWLTGGRGDCSGVWTRAIDYCATCFKWQIRSDVGPGGLNAADPMVGRLVKFGDIIHLQSQYDCPLGNIWLAGGRANCDVVWTKAIDGCTTCYQWQIRSNVGPGGLKAADPRAGEFVTLGDIVHLQSQYTCPYGSIWLSGGRGADNASVKTASVDTCSACYQWQIRTDAGSGELIRDTHCPVHEWFDKPSKECKTCPEHLTPNSDQSGCVPQRTAGLTGSEWAIVGIMATVLSGVAAVIGLCTNCKNRGKSHTLDEPQAVPFME